MTEERKKRKERYQPDDISVIIPTWNNEQTIAPLLESLFAQPALPGEILVIDDCSTDNTCAIVKRYPSPVRLLQQEKNGGAASARNRGIAEAKGEVLFFLDSDTVLLPKGIDALLDGFNTHQHCVAQTGQTTSTPLNKGLGAKYKAVIERAWHDSISPWDDSVKVFIARIGAYITETVRETGGFDENIRGANVEDIELGIRYTKIYPIHFNPDLQAHHHFSTVPETVRNYWNRTIGFMKLKDHSPKSLGSGGLSSVSAMQYMFAFLFSFSFLLTFIMPGCWLCLLSLLLGVCFLVSARRELTALFKAGGFTFGVAGTLLHLLYGVVIVTAAIRYKLFSR